MDVFCFLGLLFIFSAVRGVVLAGPVSGAHVVVVCGQLSVLRGVGSSFFGAAAELDGGGFLLRAGDRRKKGAFGPRFRVVFHAVRLARALRCLSENFALGFNRGFVVLRSFWGRFSVGVPLDGAGSDGGVQSEELC